MFTTNNKNTLVKPVKKRWFFDAELKTVMRL